jgi:DNA polymerase I-like protein with 3'-5' exonuclease and polymerase domains
MSFSKDVLTELSYSVDGELKTILKNHLEISQSKNMITQYIPKYYGSTVNGRLHYSLKLMGTFTGRLSGKAGGDKLDESIKHKLGANGVTQPVGHRVYGKLVKKMFIAPPGRIMAAVDYNGLENHINACLTKDSTTIKLLSPDPETGLMWDMHTLHSTIFFKEK